MDKRNFNPTRDIAKMVEMVDNQNTVAGQQSNDQLRGTIKREARYVNQLRLAESELSLRDCSSKSMRHARKERWARSELHVGFTSPTPVTVWFQSIKLPIRKSIKLIAKERVVTFYCQLSFSFCPLCHRHTILTSRTNLRLQIANRTEAKAPTL